MNKTDLIKSLIKESNLNMKSFARKADIPYTTLRSMLERGIENASVNNVIKVCQNLNITIEELYNVSKNDNLSYEENVLLKYFNELNDLGKKEALKRISELSQITSYKYKPEDKNAEGASEKEVSNEEKQKLYYGMAAHNDFADDENEQKLMMEDLDEL